MTTTNPSIEPVCSCPDDRCAGFHHEVGDPCPCSSYAKSLPDAAPSQLACPAWCTSPAHGLDWLPAGGWSFTHEQDAPPIALSSGRASSPYVAAESVIREVVPGRLTVEHLAPRAFFDDSLVGVGLTAEDCGALAFAFLCAAGTLRQIGGQR